MSRWSRRASYIVHLLGALAVGCTPIPAVQKPLPGLLVLWTLDSIVTIDGKPPHAVRPIPLDDRFRNIISCSVAGDRLALVSLTDNSTAFSVSVIDFRTGKLLYETQAAAQTVALHRQGELIAFTRSVPNEPGSYDVCVWEPRKSIITTVASGAARFETSLMWGPASTDLTFDDNQGWIQIINFQTRSMRKLVAGEQGRWSADGRYFAYRRGRTLYIYDASTQKHSPLLRRSFAAAEFAGQVAWSPDTRYVAASLYAGLDGQERRHIVIDRVTGEAQELTRGSYFLGDWLPNE
ncbi:MAG TPA: hypothetical protein VNA69_19320 [Thermoanaerobaculia bacterium]|nr:hypothetical protein [Thermoanaerobaculia bacterium]